MTTDLAQAEFWHDVIAVEHAIVACVTCRELSHGDRGSPQPTFIGSAFKPGGVMFVSSNPAVSPEEWGSLRDRRFAEARDTFHASPTLGTYNQMVSEMHSQAQGLGATGPQRWRGWTHPVSKCVAACLSLDQIAWGNVCKHRTPGDAAKDRPATTKELGHGLSHLRSELDVLAPNAIVAVGVAATEMLQGLTGPWRLLQIKLRGATTIEAFSIRDSLRGLGLCSP